MSATAIVIDILLALIGAVGLYGSTVVPARIAKKANQRAADRLKEEEERQADVDRLKVQADSYERAQAVNERVVQGLEHEIERLNASLGDLRAQLAIEKATSVALTERVVVMQESLNRMRELLSRHQIPVPDVPV